VATTDFGGSQQIGQKTRIFPTVNSHGQSVGPALITIFEIHPVGDISLSVCHQLGTAKMAAPKAPNFGMTEHQQLENGAKAKSRLGKSRGCQS
jgi:hypothetical protein